MNVLGATRYCVFGSPTFRGNPVTLFAVDALDDSASLLRAAHRSSTEDNVFFIAAGREPVMARFFSTTAELWLCGHGLLALSHHLRAAEIGARKVQSPSGSWQIFSDAKGPGVLLPALQATEVAASAHWMNQALLSIGIKHECLYLCANDVWVVMLNALDELLDINAELVAALDCGATTPGALIAALRLQHVGYGFRYFAPWHGKPEDSGTGSAHCYLAPLMLDSPAPVTALQYSPEGAAEMRIGLRNDAVAVSGRVCLEPSGSE